LLRRQHGSLCRDVSVFINGDVFVPFEMFEFLLFEGGDGIDNRWNLI